MGNCCGVEGLSNADELNWGERPDTPGLAKPEARTEDETTAGSTTETAAKQSDRRPKASQADVDTLMAKLELGVDTVVLLATGMGLKCQLRYDDSRRVLSLSRGDNYREITASQIKKVLFTREQLKKIETKANLVDDNNCCGLLMTTGTCITLRFDQLKDNHVFIATMQQIINRQSRDVA
eukprot:Polyplicarium_translucidae@DN2853_c0_g1_i1.p1